MDYFSSPAMDAFLGPCSLSFGENISGYKDTGQDSKEEDSLPSFVIESSTNNSSHRRGMRAPIDERTLRKGTWNPEEDKIVLEHVRKYGAKDWNIIPSTGLLLRSGKSCRQRWLSKLRPGLKRVKFSADEGRIVQQMQQEIGNKWSKIAANLPGRTDNDVKNFFYNGLRRISRQKKKNVASVGLLEYGPETSILDGQMQSHSQLGEKSFIKDKSVKPTSDVCQHEPSNGAQLEKLNYDYRENSEVIDTQDLTRNMQPVTFVTQPRENGPCRLNALASSIAQLEKPFYDFNQIVPLNSLISDHEFGDKTLKSISDVCQYEPSNGAQLEDLNFEYRENSTVIDTQDFTRIVQPMTFVTQLRENDPHRLHVLTSSFEQLEKPFYDFSQVDPLNSLLSDNDFGNKTVKPTSNVCQHEPSNGAQLEKLNYDYRENLEVIDTQDCTRIMQPVTFVTQQGENDSRRLHALASSVAQLEKPFYDFTQIVQLNSLLSDHEFGDHILFPELGGITFAEDCKHPFEVLLSSDIGHEEIKENVVNSSEIDSFFHDLPDLF